jgi:pimeloyl-ACP methyl ester carboxylesterase
MSVLCLTGWQQPADALASIAPDALHFDYSTYDSVDAVFAALPRAPRLAVGWSLGGQLLVRAIAMGHIRPQALILLGAPFQWVEDANFSGVSKAMAGDARANYAAQPQAMLKNLNALVALGDAHEKSILRSLNASLSLWKRGPFWLDELTRTSCRELNFSGFPPTVIIHGAKDKVIYPHNAHAFKELLPQAELQLWPECAHAPQLHDAAAFRELVLHYV